jgi:hypothetical protein
MVQEPSFGGQITGKSFHSTYRTNRTNDSRHTLKHSQHSDAHASEIDFFTNKNNAGYDRALENLRNSLDQKITVKTNIDLCKKFSNILNF